VLRNLFIALSVTLILWVTLVPGDPESPTNFGLCILCGYAGGANAIRNIVLFLPLGAALAALGVGLLPATLAGAALSAGVEAAQWLIPGRSTTPGDLLFNTIGAAAGVLLWRLTPWVVARRGTQAAAILALAAALGFGTLAATAYVLAPALPDRPYFGLWASEPGNTAPFHGWLNEVNLGGRPVPRGESAAAAWVGSELRAGQPLSFRAEFGPPEREYGPLFLISDLDWTAPLEIGSVRRDLVVHFRWPPRPLLVLWPGYTIPDALVNIGPWDTLDLAIQRTNRGYCMDVGSVRHCRIGFTLGQGWEILLGPEGLPPGARNLLNALWLLGLVLPMGFVSPRGTHALLAGAATLAAAYAITAGFDLQFLPLLEAAGIALGVLAGYGLRRLRQPTHGHVEGEDMMPEQ
jgi:hypothetical protein